MTALGFVEPMKRAGHDLTREKFVEACESIDKWQDPYDLYPPLSFGPELREGSRYVQMIKVVGGEWVQISKEWVTYND